MKEQLNKILTAVAVETLEKLAFIFAFPYDEEKTDLQNEATTASVSFRGIFSGSLAIKVSQQALPELAANMLGLEQEEETTSAHQQQDALKETINVICGNLLPKIAGDQNVFNIDAPRIIAEVEPIDNDDGNKSASFARLALEEGQCDLYLFVDGQIPTNEMVTDSCKIQKI